MVTLDRGEAYSRHLPSGPFSAAKQAWTPRLIAPLLREAGRLKGMAEVLERSFSARLDCHYLLQIPDRIDERTALVVTLHGFGGNPESMLNMTDRLFEPRPVIAALQGPFQFFLSAAAREVVYGWITNRLFFFKQKTAYEMVLHVLEEVGSEFGIP